MSSFAKFSGPDLDPSTEFTHPNLWQREEHPDWSRLCIGACEREIPLILDMCRECSGPFGVLYVLLVSRLGHGDGRYQNPQPIDYDELALFLFTFQEFFEQDGRHHLWVRSLNDGAQFIFDNHNMVYAYGDLARFELMLAERGFTRGPVAVPVPHAHHYHPEFDQSEDEMMTYWAWKKFPLQDDDVP